MTVRTPAILAVLEGVLLVCSGCVSTGVPPTPAPQPAPAVSEPDAAAGAAQGEANWDRFAYGGRVVDERGMPVPDVTVVATYRLPADGGYGYIDTSRTDLDGRFSISRAEAASGSTPETLRGQVRLDFKHPRLLYTRVEDVHAFSPEARTSLAVRMRDGQAIRGRVVDAFGRTVPKAMVQAEFGQDYDFRKACLTDMAGNFTLRGLPSAAARLECWTIDPVSQPLSGMTDVEPAADGARAEIMLSPVVVPREKVKYRLFGMTLVDVDKDLQKAFFLPEPTGVLVLDAGPDSERLKIGRLERGDSFWIVGESPVKDFAELAANLQAAWEGQNPDEDGRREVPVVYRFRRTDQSGTNTQYLALTPREVAEVRAAVK